MRALRALTAVLLAGLAAAGGSRTSAQTAPVLTAVCGEPSTELRPVEPPSRSETFFVASSAAAVPGAVEEGGRTHVPAARTLRPVRPAPMPAPAARAAAVVRDRLDFARRLDVAKLGYFCFGSTSPPPFRI